MGTVYARARKARRWCLVVSEREGTPRKRDIPQGGEAACKAVADGMLGSIPRSRTLPGERMTQPGKGPQVHAGIPRGRLQGLMGGGLLASHADSESAPRRFDPYPPSHG